MSFDRIKENVIVSFREKHSYRDINTFTIPYVVNEIVHITQIHCRKCPVGLPNFHYDLVLSVLGNILECKTGEDRRNLLRLHQGVCKKLARFLLQPHPPKMVFRFRGKRSAPNGFKIYHNILKKKLRLYDDVHVLILRILEELAHLQFSVDNRYLETTVKHIMRYYMTDFFHEGLQHPWNHLIKVRYVDGFVSYIRSQSVSQHHSVCCTVL